jgi:hypothetical protein
MPSTFFIRAVCVAKSSSMLIHQEMHQFAKGIKQFYVTTGLGVSYHNEFEVSIFNI